MSFMYLCAQGTKKKKCAWRPPPTASIPPSLSLALSLSLLSLSIFLHTSLYLSLSSSLARSLILPLSAFPLSLSLSPSLSHPPPPPSLCCLSPPTRTRPGDKGQRCVSIIWRRHTPNNRGQSVHVCPVTCGSNVKGKSVVPPGDFCRSFTPGLAPSTTDCPLDPSPPVPAKRVD